MYDNDEKLKLIAQGNELSQKGFFYEARQHFFALSEAHPDCPQVKIAALNNTALKDRRRAGNGVATAIKNYKEVLKISPDEVHALLSIGVLMRRTKPTLALKYLDKALALQSSDAKIWEVKGWCYRQLEDIESELECYYASQKIKASFVIQSTIKGAKSRLREACKTDPNFPHLQNYWVKILNSDGLHHVVTENYDAALECYQEVLRLEPESVFAQNSVVDVLLKRSDQLMQHRKFDDARKDVTQVLQISSSSEIVLRCKEQGARIDLIEEIAEFKKRSVSRTSSANNFWAPEGSSLKRSFGSDTDKDDNARPMKQSMIIPK